MFCHNTFGSISFDSCQILRFLIFLNILNLQKSENWKRRKDTRYLDTNTFEQLFCRTRACITGSGRLGFWVIGDDIALMYRILASRYIHMHRKLYNICMNFITYLKIIEIQGGFLSVNTYLPKRNIFQINESDICYLFFYFQMDSKVSWRVSLFYCYRIIINSVIISVNSICQYRFLIYMYMYVYCYETFPWFRYTGSWI